MNTNTLYTPLTEPLRNAMAARCKKDAVAGMSLVLADATGPLLSINHGYADLDARIPCTEDTLMGVASVTKLFTATGVMQQAEDGRLDITSPISAYIPEFRVKSRYDGAPPIRVIDLMTHHSGLPRDWLRHFYAYQPEPFHRLIECLWDEYISRPAGTFYSYSNLGVSLLGIVLERVSGMAYEAYITERILRPIGMEKSGFSKSYSHAGLYAQTYDGLKRRAELPMRDIPAGGLFASAKELGHFIGLYLSGGTYNGHKILLPETIDRMLTPQTPDVPMDFGKKIGLNWHLNRPALAYAGRVAHHGGSLVCYRAELCILPDHGLGAAVVSNSATASQAVLDLAEDGLKLALALKTGIVPQRTKAPAFVLRPGVSATTPEGHYATSRGYVHIRLAPNGYHFLWRQRSLILLADKEGAYTLCHENGGTVMPDARFTGRPLRFCVDPGTGKKVMLIDGWPDGEGFIPKPVPAAWAARLGTYHAYNRLPEEAFTDIPHAIQLSIKRGILHMESIGPGHTEVRVLSPVNDEEAVRLGWSQSDNETLHSEHRGADTTLSYMGIKFHQINVTERR